MVARPSITYVDVTPPEHLAVLAQMKELHRECLQWLITEYGRKEALQHPMLQYIVEIRLKAEVMLRRGEYRVW